MADSITIRSMYYHELETVSELVLRVFDEHVSVEGKGRESFAQYIQPAMLEKRLKRGDFVLVARLAERIVGVIEIREHKHIALLFVETAYQRQGIAKNLIDEALVYCLRHDPNLKEITVNASANALKFYEKLGFRAYGEPANELHATPMVYELNAKNQKLSTKKPTTKN
jgi:GNAT superfamily N-acetyltransferase